MTTVGLKKETPQERAQEILSKTEAYFDERRKKLLAEHAHESALTKEIINLVYSEEGGRITTLLASRNREIELAKESLLDDQLFKVPHKMRVYVWSENSLVTYIATFNQEGRPTERGVDRLSSAKDVASAMYRESGEKMVGEFSNYVFSMIPSVEYGPLSRYRR